MSKVRVGGAAKRSYPTSRVRAVAERSYPTSKVEQQLRFAGAAVKKYHMSKARETLVRW